MTNNTDVIITAIICVTIICKNLINKRKDGNRPNNGRKEIIGHKVTQPTPSSDGIEIDKI